MSFVFVVNALPKDGIQCKQNTHYNNRSNSKAIRETEHRRINFN